MRLRNKTFLKENYIKKGDVVTHFENITQFEIKVRNFFEMGCYIGKTYR